MLQWARENGCPWGLGFSGGFRSGREAETCEWAAKGGHLEVLQWARENGCYWDEKTCANAAEGGHLEVLQWLCANECPWHRSTRFVARGYILEWAVANGVPE